MAAAADDSAAAPAVAAGTGADDLGRRNFFYDALKAVRTSVDDVTHRSRAAAAATPELIHRGTAAADAALDYAFSATASTASAVCSSTSDLLATAAAHAEMTKEKYVELESAAIGRIKEELVLHPASSIGIALAAGIVVFKKPRSFMIQNVRRFFMSDKAIFANIKPEVDSLKQAYNLMANERSKLMTRSGEAEKRYHSGLNRLKSVREDLSEQLREIRYAEELERGMRSILKELPETNELQFKAQINELASKLGATKRLLGDTMSKLKDCDGMPVRK